MAYNQNTFQVTASTTLAAAVANGGTVTLAYPTGTTQADFNAGLASGGYAMLNGDKIAVGGSGIAISYGASNITVTNNTGASWAAGSTLAVQLEQPDGNDVVWLNIPIQLASITGAMDVLTDFRPGIAGTIEYIQFAVTVAVTTAAKLASLNVEIETTDLTGGVVALTSANATPLGKVIAGSDITGNNTLTRASKISVEASAVTAFAEGAGVLSIRIRKAVS